MGRSPYKVGKFLRSWKEGEAQTITFVVTEDCNLRCKYCYITHKASNKKMKLEDAKKFVDYILTADIKRTEAVIIDFIGGEPFIEVDLIDRITDYFKIRAFELGRDWFWNYRINICTNGVNYSDPDVQAYINKNFGKMSVAITLDGTKEKHDLQRVFANGDGSFDTIIPNIDLWKSQFTASTKVTFASDDLFLLKDSIIDLWNRGIAEVAANVVFEDVWKEEDDKLFESQLIALADYVLDNRLYDKYLCTLFSDSLGGYLNEEQLQQTSCGAGKMMALGVDAKIYPCMRYMAYSLNNNNGWHVGDIENGIDMERVRPFMTATTKLQSDSECINCEIANGCNFCQGYNYDESATASNFYRAKYICKMHKARVRANEYYFAKLFNRFGIKRDSLDVDRKKLYFLLSDNFVNYCATANHSIGSNAMSRQAIFNGLQYSRENFFDAVFVHPKDAFTFKEELEYEAHLILHMVPAKFYKEAACLHKYLLVFDHDSISLPTGHIKNCMFNISSDRIEVLFEDVAELLKKADRINLNILDINKLFDEALYKKQLLKIKDLLIEWHRRKRIIKEVSLITDLCHMNRPNNCKAGDRSFVYAPDENIYACSGLYSKDRSRQVGDVKHGLDNLLDAQLYKRKYNALCGVCDAYQCLNCICINQEFTNEINVSPSFQCRKSHIEREVARLYQLGMKSEAGDSRITELTYLDPIKALYEKNNISVGYYEY